MDPLATYTDAQLAKAWCHLNVYEWPSVLPRKLDNEYTYGELKRLIVDRVGYGACLEMWRKLEFYKGKGHRLAK